MTHFDTIVMGGGIGGLAVAAMLGRAGQRVLLLERAGVLGGRADTTEVEGGYLLNLGGHALYRTGHGARVLGALGVRVRGGRPSRGPRPQGLWQGEAVALPVGAGAAFGAEGWSWGDRWEVGRGVAAAVATGGRGQEGLPLARWIDARFERPRARALFEALARVSTYANAPERSSAGATLAQVRQALVGDVLYLDGGWRTIVRGLEEAARGAGVEIRLGAAARRLEGEGRRWSVAWDEGEGSAEAAVLAGPPSMARGLLGAGRLGAALDGLVPIQAACLDVALDGLPRPEGGLLLGLDAPLYASVHSGAAALAPEGGGVIHAMKYLAPGEVTEPGADIEALESLLDVAQPGWRGRVVHRRALPRMTVAGAHALAERGGLAGRPSVEIEGIEGVFLVGDWVGDRGMLADASLASAERAAEAILARSRAVCRVA